MGSKQNAVQVAYLCSDVVHYSWHRCMLSMIEHDLSHNRHITRAGHIAMRPGSGELASARNDAVRHFLSEGKADWLWWVDTDMGFRADTVDQLLKAAHPKDRPIVGGLCFFNRTDDPDGMGGYTTTVVPTIYDWTHEEDGRMGWQVRWNYPPNALTRVGATGSACILIHRSVFEKLAEHPGNGLWYDRVPNTTTGQLMGEDLSFCLRAGALDIPVHVHTGVPTTHFKPMWLQEGHYVKQMLLNSVRESLSEPEPEPAA